MDGRIKIAIGCFFSAIMILLAWISLAAPIKGGSETFLVLTAKTLGHKLPKCYGPSCAARLHRLNIQIKTAQYIYGDAVLAYQGKLYHTHVWRAGIKNQWIWYFQGHRMWYRVMKWLRKQHLAKIIGPAEIRTLEKMPANCSAVAEAILVNVTSDGGTLQQPSPITTKTCKPSSDAGPGACTTIVTKRKWPNDNVIRCGNGKYYLTRSRLGGRWRGLSPTPDSGPAPPLKSDDARAGTPGYVSPKAWEQPDARVFRNCPRVPVGIKCPK